MPVARSPTYCPESEDRCTAALRRITNINQALENLDLHGAYKLEDRCLVPIALPSVVIIQNVVM